jgi:hypothetical protein
MVGEKKPIPYVPKPPGKKCSKTTHGELHRRAYMERKRAAKTGEHLKNAGSSCRESIPAPSATSAIAAKIRSDRRESKTSNKPIANMNTRERPRQNTKAGLRRNSQQRERQSRGGADRPSVPGVLAVSVDDVEVGVPRHLPDSPSVEDSKDKEEEEIDTQTNTHEASVLRADTATFLAEATLVVSNEADRGQAAGFVLARAKPVNNKRVAILAFIILFLVIVASIFGTLFAKSALGDRNASSSTLDATETQPPTLTVNPVSTVPPAAPTTFSPSAMQANLATPSPTTPTPAAVTLLPTAATATDGPTSIAPTPSCMSAPFQPLGQDLFAPNYLWFGTSVDLDDSGSILAVGAERGAYVQVYVHDESSMSATNEPWGWSLMGQQLDGPPGSNFGNSVSLSGNGMVLACGGELVPFGLVRVYKYLQDRNEWQQMGQDLIGEEETDDFGYAVALSWNGLMLAVGTFERGENVHVYRYETDTATWVQIGFTLRGPPGSLFGGSLDFASNGTILAVGAVRGAASLGSVRVFEYEPAAEDWTQIGAEVTGDYIGSYGSSTITYDWFGSDFAVKLSSDGTILAVGAWGANFAKVFELDSSRDNWVQKGQQIDGKNQGRLGISVALSSDGTLLAVGEDWPEQGPGHVYVFSFNSATNQWDLLQDIEGSQPGDWFGWCVALSQDGSVLAAGSLGAGQARAFSAKGCHGI